MSHGHASLGPSAAKRWMTCPGSVTLIEAVDAQLGDEPDSPYAALGTSLHSAAEWCLVNDKGSHEAVGMEFDGHEVVDDDVEKYEEFVSLMRHLPGQKFYESKVTIIPDVVWGTADGIAIEATTLYVADLKTGYVRVDAEDNPQLLLYALGALMAYSSLYDIDKVVMIISQPSIEWESRWEVGVDYLNAFYEKVVEAVEATRTQQDKLVPSDDACRYCRARGTCPELARMARTEAQQEKTGDKHTDDGSGH